MTEEIADALAILERAMQIEREGQEFYQKAAATTKDEKGQGTFRTLAGDEQTHFRLIQKQHDALTSEGKWVASPEIKQPRVDWDKPLFPGQETLAKEVTSKSTELDALLFGLGIESKSWDFYRKATLQTADTLGRAMFEFLAGQEKIHFEILMMRYEYLSGPVPWQA